MQDCNIVNRYIGDHDKLMPTRNRMHAVAAAAAAAAAAAPAAAVRAWAPHQEESICENGKDLPARIVCMPRNATMQLPAARFKRQIVAAKASSSTQAWQ